ncbi:MAG: FadR/GntR family transcriptional regulator [Bacillota bacterium]
MRDESIHNGLVNGNLKRSRKSRLYEDVVNHITQLIRTGVLASGDQLAPERQLAEMFGVSRAAIREALTALASKGLIEISPGVGACITQPKMEDMIEALAAVVLKEESSVLDLLEVRKLLEPQVAGLAAERAESQDLKRIRECALRVQDEITAGLASDDSDTSFHIAVADAAHNRVLSDIMGMLSGLMIEAYGPIRKKLVAHADDAGRSIQHHHMVYEAIAQRDKDKAEAAMRLLLETVEEGVNLIWSASQDNS